METSPINIAFIMNGAKPPRGGEFLTLHLITHLRKDIFHPILIYAEDGIIVREIKKSDIESVNFPLNKNITGIYPREIKLYNPIFIFIFIWYLVTKGSIFRLKRILKEHNIHLIYCADNLSKLIGGIAGKVAGIKVVAHCHDDFKEYSLGVVIKIFYMLLLDKILAVSEKVRKFFVIN
jgi:UDP-N-acetylglucosamine:LPS N-acetylglucosamine transferase